MTDAQDGGVATTAAPQTNNDGFLTREQLRDRARFTFEERELEIPELGGGKVGLRGLSVAQRETLSAGLPDDPSEWTRKHTAASLAAYVSNPKLSAGEWAEDIEPWPSAALDRINREIFEIVNVGAEEAASAGVEFPAKDD